MNGDRFLEDYSAGEVVRAPGFSLTEADVIDFAFRYDPQPFHIDKTAAEASIYGGLIASGWQVAILAFRSICWRAARQRSIENAVFETLR